MKRGSSKKGTSGKRQQTVPCAACLLPLFFSGAMYGRLPIADFKKKDGNEDETGKQ